jgi:release factor glutamine methyltransferase
MPEVQKFEPATALDGGTDGLTAYRAIFAALPALLATDGTAVLEFGIGQAQLIVDIAAKAGFHAALAKDLAGHERAAIITRRK